MTKAAEAVLADALRLDVEAHAELAKELNQNAKGIGTRFKLSTHDARTIEARARIVVPLVLGDDGSGALGPPRVPVVAGTP